MVTIEEIISTIEHHLNARGMVFTLPPRRKNEYVSSSMEITGKNFHLKIEPKGNNYVVTIAKNGKHGFIIELFWSNLEDILKSAESLAILCLP